MNTFYIGHSVYSELDYFSSAGEWDGSFFEEHGIVVHPTKTYVTLKVPDEALKPLLLEVSNAEDILADQASCNGDIGTVAIHRGMATLFRKLQEKLA